MKKPIVTFEQFSFQYHSQAEPTLHDINITLYSGEKVLVVGPSGSGKSTFAQCINGLIPYKYEGVTSGKVKINGKDLCESNLFDLSFDVSTVLQDTDDQFIGLTVAEDIAFALENDEVSQKEMHKIVDKWAKVVGLTAQLKNRPQDLSGGQKQRASMAGVLVDEAPILLFDEPLANLDPATGKAAIELIDEIHQQTQGTVLIIEHRLEDVLHRLVDRVIVFNEGRIIADLSPNDLLRSPILQEIGIREPLYITAMKYADISLAEAKNLADVCKVTAPNLKENLLAWQQKNSVATAQEHFLNPLLTLENINFSYDHAARSTLTNISTTIYQGEMLSIVGKNGAGKSTLSQIICGFLKPTGNIIWKNQDLSLLSIKERADKIGFVMQNPNQMISKKMVFEEVALGLILRQIPLDEVNQRVEKVLKICGLYPFRNWPISALSFGQKKRVTIAAILILEPELLILDEPTAGQDFKHYTEMMEFLEKLNQSGMTVMMITHDMHLMLEYTNRALVIADGQLIADRLPVDVLTDSALIAESALKVTSLMTFAKQVGLSDPYDFTKTFIQYDREVRFGE